MKYLILLLFTYLIFSFYSCGSPEWQTTLYSQKIEGSSKILYKYDAWGGRDTNVAGYIILDSTETFEVDISKNLPFSYLEEIPNKKYILGLEFEKPDYENLNNNKKEIFTPINSTNRTEGEIDIKTKIYQYNTFRSKIISFEEFQFESFKETRDSLFFYNLDDVINKQTKHLDSLKLKKKNIILSQNKNHEIIKIEIKDLILTKKSNEIISNKTYFLTPKKKIKSNLFSDYGIFKEDNK